MGTALVSLPVTQSTHRELSLLMGDSDTPCLDKQGFSDFCDWLTNSTTPMLPLRASTQWEVDGWNGDAECPEPNC